MHFRFLSLFAFLALLTLPFVAFAQDGGESVLENPLFLGVGFAVLAAIELAKRVVALIPGKPASQILGIVERVVRGLLDLLAGKNGDPKDPSLLRRGE